MSAEARPNVAPRPVRSILAATDFSPCSAEALKQAIRIAGLTGADLRVVHVIDTTVVIEIETAISEYQKDIRESLVRDASAAWRQFAASIPGAAALPIEIVINNRLAGILQHAHQVDLLVMGAFGDRRPEVGFGTVATACVRKSMSDVLLVRDTLSGPFRTVIAAVDFSETSARALERAACLAAQDDAELHVLHVLSAPWHRLHYRPSTLLVSSHAQSQYREVVETRLRDFASLATERHSGLRVRTACCDGTGHCLGIVEYARSAQADLVVLGTHGKTRVRDILLGSTAERVLSESACSVLAVKPEGFAHPLATPRSTASVA